MNISGSRTSVIQHWLRPYLSLTLLSQLLSEYFSSYDLIDLNNNLAQIHLMLRSSQSSVKNKKTSTALCTKDKLLDSH